MDKLPRNARNLPPTFARMIKSDAALRVRPLGRLLIRTPDVYHQLLRASWWRLTLYFLITFFLFNCVFAGLFLLDRAGFTQPNPPIAAPEFWRLFFFSIETVATVGYGNMVPVSLYANILVAIEISLGILFFALVTGIMFARFSRPTARMVFSTIAVVTPIDGVPTLMFRAANQRHNLIFEAAVRVSILADEDVAGTRMRRFRDLKLVRHSNPVFLLTWTVMHAIDQDSPLRGWLDNPDAAGNAEIIAVLSGTDDASGQTIHGRWAYSAADIRWDAQFEDIIGLGDDGVRTIDYTRFHDTVAPR